MLAMLVLARLCLILFIWGSLGLATAATYVSHAPGGGGTPLQEPNGDVPLDGVAFSRLE